jgi:HSP20 family protein
MRALVSSPGWSDTVRKPLADFQRDFDRMVGQFFRSGLPNGEAAIAAAPLSFWEDEGSFYVEVDLPGVDRDAVDVTVERNQLRISAERKAPEQSREYWHNERSYQRVERAVLLPETANADSIEAELKDGVLSVKLAKRAEAQPKKISVKAN